MESLPPGPHRTISLDASVVRASSLMRRTNVRLRELLADPFVETGPIAFFCECRSATCFSVIWMTGTAFDVIETGQGGWLLRHGHKPSASWHRRDTDRSERSPDRARPAIARPSGSSMTSVA